MLRLLRQARNTVQRLLRFVERLTLNAEPYHAELGIQSELRVGCDVSHTITYCATAILLVK